MRGWKLNYLMKAKTIIATAFASFFILYSAFGQGALTPPGAPAPTMKSLDQIEPRTPISSAPFTITVSGSYYLTTNVNVTTGDAITIIASQVTLDLNGFTISSTAPSATNTGILLAGGDTDITILNGHIVGGVTNNAGVYGGSGFANGIFFSAATPSNVRVTGISVSGCLTYGIFLNAANATAVVESCTVQTNGGYGIYAMNISRSTAYQCGLTAISASTVSDCNGQSTGSGDGLDASTANNCTGYSVDGYGLTAENANNCTGVSRTGEGLACATANNCYGQCIAGFNTGLAAYNAINCEGQSKSGTGLSASETATGCYGQSSNFEGLFAITAHNCSGTSGGSGPGLDAFTADNCYGNSNSGYGLSASAAHNCYAQSNGNSGLQATVADNCFGDSSSGTGLDVSGGIATGCYGYSASGIGITAQIANSCIIGHGTTNITYKYNMP